MQGVKLKGTEVHQSREGAPSQELPAWLARNLERCPRLKRWPHPAVVHFPIVFMWSATFFTLLHLWTGNQSFESTAFHCLGGGVLTLPGAMVTGLATHRLNFPGENGTITLERRLSWLLLALAVTAFAWRWANPLVLADLEGTNLLYLAILLALTPVVTVTSYFGGMLTYPLEAASKETGIS